MIGDAMAAKEASAGYVPPADRPAIPTGYKQSEAGVIPEDWEVSRIGQTCSLVSTGKLDANAMVENGAYRFYTCAKNFYRIDTYAFDCEALLISGNGAHVGYVHYYNGKFNAYQRTYVLSGFKSSIKYVQHYLEKNFRDRIQVEVRAGGTPYITRGTITESLIPLPTTASEQESIATALSDVDALLEELDRLIAKKRDIKQAAMQQLLTGETRLPGFEGEWIRVKFSAMATLSNARIDPSRSEGSDFCIELEHISQGTGLLNGSTATTENSSLKAAFEPGDVLFGKLRAYLKKYWIASRSGVCSTEIWVLKANHQLVLPQYLFQIVTTDSFIESASTAYGTHMPRSDWKVVRETQWPIPCIDEQQAIAAVLSDMDAEIQALEQRRSKTAELKQGMMQELLTGRTRLV